LAPKGLSFSLDGKPGDVPQLAKTYLWKNSTDIYMYKYQQNNPPFDPIDNNPEMVNTVGSLLPFPIKFPDVSKDYFIKTIKRMNSLVQNLMTYHKMGLLLTTMTLDNIG
jgi:hypothetical protein